ncbi:hypothetical protein [Paenibacillus glycanilyticus]|uniref:DUF1453 domain-containing protein n=1 Tax=Paenibacillus glycanilyticus TaxID=126569 RepID=A0ABQ6GGM8_9BACL|nr:hypothetical protein [Paenibacillus glycanilyticus]GLX69645.1 hypothetical protein MU1_39900 [Paenibacillus glycanilyticus]
MILSNGIYLLIMVVICFRLAREKNIRPATLWIVPALYAMMVLQNINQTESINPIHIFLYAVSIVIGLGVGIWRGQLDKVRWNAATGTVTSQSPISGIAILAAIVLLRLAIDHFGGHDQHMITASNALLFISVGSVCGRRFLNYTRYKQLKVGN